MLDKGSFSEQPSDGRYDPVKNSKLIPISALNRNSVTDFLYLYMRHQPLFLRQIINNSLLTRSK